MNNITPLAAKNQYWIKRNSETLFSRNPEKYIRQLSYGKRCVLDALIHGSNIYNAIMYSQQTIADRAGVSLRTVNGAVREFEEHGVIRKHYYHRQTCTYEMNPFLYEFQLRYRLRDIITSFSWLPRILLVMFALCNDIQKLKCKKYKDDYCVPLSYERKVYLYTNRPFLSRDSITRARVGDGGDFLQKNGKTFKKGVIMEQFKQQLYPDSPVPPYIRAISEIKLTKWGQIRLTAFPERAVDAARKKIRYFGKAKDPFAFFFKACLDFCKDENIVPDWKWCDALAISHNVPANAPMLLLSTPSTQKEIRPAIIQNPVIMKDPCKHGMALCNQCRFATNPVFEETKESVLEQEEIQQPPTLFDVFHELHEWEEAYDRGDYKEFEKITGFMTPPFLVAAFKGGRLPRAEQERLVQKYPALKRSLGWEENDKPKHEEAMAPRISKPEPVSAFLKKMGLSMV